MDGLHPLPFFPFYFTWLLIVIGLAIFNIWAQRKALVAREDMVHRITEVRDLLIDVLKEGGDCQSHAAQKVTEHMVGRLDTLGKRDER